MRKLKDAHVFSNEEGSIAKFFVYAASYVVSLLTADILFAITSKEAFKWKENILSSLILFAFLTVVYFISRFLAYRTNIFPKAKYREAIHGVSFFILIILSIVLFIVLQ